MRFLTFLLVLFAANARAASYNWPNGGATGATGPSGTAGATGAKGSTGASGATGTTGAIGSIGAFSTTPNSNGLDVTGPVLTLHAASPTGPGAVSIGQQGFTGEKDFSNIVSADEIFVNGGITTHPFIDLGGDATDPGTPSGSDVRIWSQSAAGHGVFSINDDVDHSAFLDMGNMTSSRRYFFPDIDGTFWVGRADIYISGFTGNLTTISANETISGGFTTGGFNPEQAQGTATIFACVSNPTLKLQYCSNASCASTTDVASVTFTSGGTGVTDGSVSNPIPTNRYWRIIISAGTCTALNASINVEGDIAPF